MDDFVRSWRQQQQQKQQQQQLDVCESSAAFDPALKLLAEISGFTPRSRDSCAAPLAASVSGSESAAAVLERVASAHALLDSYLGFSFGQGHSGQVEALTAALSLLSKDASSFCQTGFNSGHSAVTVLESNPTIKVLSFDIGWESVVFTADRFIQENALFSRRHELARASAILRLSTAGISTTFRSVIS
jgi:hypothetical protein